MLIHATALALAVDADGPLAGVLLLGASGAGKSMLALAAIEACPWRRTALIADDAAEVRAEGGRAVASAPAPIRGLIEVRGFGPAPVRSVAAAPVIAAFDLDAPAARLPDPGRYPVGERLSLPLYPFAPGEAGPARLRVAVRSILGGQT
ncbi:MAG: hypothetical protein VX640_07440 [Pseudomonadota bacterium]|nr:hypothetical protein [Pseudomonadota bacterium]